MLMEFVNRDDGVRSAVTLGTNGFHVTLFDLDAQEYLPVVKCFPTLDRATAYAKSLVGA